jgi:polyhydroxyalkanoate synthesis repressor PhaR
VLQCVKRILLRDSIPRPAPVGYAAARHGGRVIVVKKYPNRRLYDTAHSRYVNLQDLADLIRAGEDVQVVDDAGADLTREVLLQIVFEVLKGGDLFPTGFLRRFIRTSSDGPAQALLRQQLVTGLEVLSAQMDQVEALFRAVPPPPAPGAPPPPETPETPATDDAELAALRQRLAALEERLRKP